MHNMSSRFREIFNHGTEIEMEIAQDYLEKIICIAKTNDFDTVKYYNIELRTIVEKEITCEMIDEVLPSTYWTKEQVHEVLKSKGLNVRLEDAYFLANYYYKCYHDIIDQETILAMTVKDIDSAMQMWKIAKMKKH